MLAIAFDKNKLEGYGRITRRNLIFGYTMGGQHQGSYKPRHRWLETDFGLKPRFPLNQWFETKPNQVTSSSYTTYQRLYQSQYEGWIITG